MLIGPELKYERRSLFLSVETVPRGMTIAYQTHSKMKKVDSTMPDLVYKTVGLPSILAGWHHWMGGGWGRGRSGKFLAHCDKEVELLVMRSRMNMSKIPREGLDSYKVGFICRYVLDFEFGFLIILHCQYVELGHDNKCKQGDSMSNLG